MDIDERTINGGQDAISGARSRTDKSTASRLLNLERMYGPPHRWVVIRRGFDPIGKHTRSGYRVFKYVILRCNEHPDEGEVIAGISEAEKYCGVKVKRPGPGRPRKLRRELG